MLTTELENPSELEILLKVTQQFPSGAGNQLTAGVQNNQGTLVKEHFLPQRQILTVFEDYFCHDSKAHSTAQLLQSTTVKHSF